MSLSNEERQTKLYWSLHHLVQESHNLPTTGYEHEKYDRLRDLCSQMWFSFLGHTSNGGHWFAGSSATNNIGKPNSPWAVALLNHFNTDRAKGKKDWMDEAREREQADFDEQYDIDRDLADRPNDSIARDAMDIDNLLKHIEDDGKGLAATYLIYAYTENLVYALRRYDDEFRDGYPVLNKLIADIQGECFGLFSANENYAKAYLLNQILDGLYAYGNPVAKLAWHQCWHHKLPGVIRHADLAKIRKWHLSLTKDPKKVTPTDWVVLALEMMGPTYEYEHSFKELIRMAGKRGIPLDEARCRAAFDVCLKAKKETSTAATDEYRTDADYEHMAAIHGNDLAYKLIWEPKHKARMKKNTVRKPRPKAKKQAKPNVKRVRKAARKEAVKAAETPKPEEPKS